MLITNPFATTTSSAGRDRLYESLSARHSVELVATTRRGHATELGALAAGTFDAVVVNGGDGSVNEVVNGMLGAPDRTDRPAAGDLPALGVIPGGNANVFARALGIDPDPVRAAAQLATGLDRGTRRPVSLGHTLGRWFLFTAGTGLDATVIRRMEQLRATGRRVTDLRYVTTALGTFLSPAHPSPTFTVDMPGRTVEEVRFGFVSNTSPWTYLGPLALRTNPGTDLDHGLGVAALTSLAVVPTLVLAGRLLTGSRNPRSAHLVREDDVPTVRFTGTSPADVQIDGDYVGRHSRLDFGCVPGALDVIAPAPASFR